MKPRHLIVPFTLAVASVASHARAWQEIPAGAAIQTKPSPPPPGPPCLVAVDYGMIMNNCPLPVEFVIPLTVTLTGAPFNNWEVDFRAATSTWCKLNLASNDGTGTGTPAVWGQGSGTLVTASLTGDFFTAYLYCKSSPFGWLGSVRFIAW